MLTPISMARPGSGAWKLVSWKDTSSESIPLEKLISTMFELVGETEFKMVPVTAPKV